MNYDNDLGSKHATFESVFGPEGSVSYWTSFGIPRSKIVIGIPFYARAGWGEEFLTYEDIISMNPSIPDTLDFVLHSKSKISRKKEYGFNGVSTVVRKVKEDPINRLNEALQKLNHEDLYLEQIDQMKIPDVEKAFKICQEIETRNNEIKRNFYDIQKGVKDNKKKIKEKWNS